MSLESCHRNKRVSCQFCNQSIPRRTKSFKTVIRLTLACALLLYCVNGSLIDISYFHSIPIFIGKLLFWTYLFTRVRHSFPKMYHVQVFIQEVPYKFVDITYLIHNIWFALQYLMVQMVSYYMIWKWKVRIRHESEFLTLIEDLVKLIIKSAIISLLSECLPKASTFVCSWSVSWYSDSQYLNVESQKTIF